MCLMSICVGADGIAWVGTWYALCCRVRIDGDLLRSAAIASALNVPHRDGLFGSRTPSGRIALWSIYKLLHLVQLVVPAAVLPHGVRKWSGYRHV